MLASPLAYLATSPSIIQPEASCNDETSAPAKMTAKESAKNMADNVDEVPSPLRNIERHLVVDGPLIGSVHRFTSDDDERLSLCARLLEQGTAYPLVRIPANTTDRKLQYGTVDLSRIVPLAIAVHAPCDAFAGLTVGFDVKGAPGVGGAFGVCRASPLVDDVSKRRVQVMLFNNRTIFQEVSFTECANDPAFRSALDSTADGAATSPYADFVIDAELVDLPTEVALQAITSAKNQPSFPFSAPKALEDCPPPRGDRSGTPVSSFASLRVDPGATFTGGGLSMGGGSTNKRGGSFLASIVERSEAGAGGEALYDSALPPRSRPGAHAAAEAAQSTDTQPLSLNTRGDRTGDSARGGPELSNLSHVSSAKRVLQLLAETHQSWEFLRELSKPGLVTMEMMCLHRLAPALGSKERTVQGVISTRIAIERMARTASPSTQEVCSQAVALLRKLAERITGATAVGHSAAAAFGLAVLDWAHALSKVPAKQLLAWRTAADMTSIGSLQRGELKYEADTSKSLVTVSSPSDISAALEGVRLFLEVVGDDSLEKALRVDVIQRVQGFYLLRHPAIRVWSFAMYCVSAWQQHASEVITAAEATPHPVLIGGGASRQSTSTFTSLGNFALYHGLGSDPVVMEIYARYLEGTRLTPQQLPSSTAKAAPPHSRISGGGAPTGWGGGATITAFVGIVVKSHADGQSAVRAGGNDSYSFNASPSIILNSGALSDQLVLGIAKAGRQSITGNSDFKRVCTQYFMEGSCRQGARCGFLHERPSDDQLRAGGMHSFIGKGTSTCETDATGTPRGASA